MLFTLPRVGKSYKPAASWYVWLIFSVTHDYDVPTAPSTSALLLSFLQEHLMKKNKTKIKTPCSIICTYIQLTLDNMTSPRLIHLSRISTPYRTCIHVYIAHASFRAYYTRKHYRILSSSYIYQVLKIII